MMISDKELQRLLWAAEDSIGVLQGAFLTFCQEKEFNFGNGGPFGILHQGPENMSASDLLRVANLVLKLRSQPNHGES